MRRLVNVKSLNDLFQVDAPEWMEVDDNDYVSCGIEPANIEEWARGEQHFWSVATPEMVAERNQKISDTFMQMTPEQWQTLINHRTKGNKQSQPITLDGIHFNSKNAAARFAMKKYCVSRNTAIRHIDEGRSFNNLKQKNRNYTGEYTGAKYE